MDNAAASWNCLRGRGKATGCAKTRRHPTVGVCGFPEACRESWTLLEGDTMDRASLLCAQHPPALTPLGLEARPVLPVTGESSQGTPAPTLR